jgi:hypothetical protein
MIALVEDKMAEINKLCAKYNVLRLEVFGSAATGEEFDPERSDFDFLVEFHRTETINAADQYFGLLEELEGVFHRHVDLVESKAMRNPYFIKGVNETRKLLYAA